MTLHCAFCGKDIELHSDGQIYAEMRKMARCKTLGFLVKILKFLGVVRK